MLIINVMVFLEWSIVSSSSFSRPGELASRLFTPEAGRIKKTSYIATNEKHYKKGDCLVLLIAEISYRV